MFIFVCPKNEPKRAAYHLAFGCPALLETAGSLKTRYAQTGSNSCFGRFCGARLREMAITKKILSFCLLILFNGHQMQFF
jgi:hypothetical protein